MVEALVCSEDWLRSCETLDNDEEEDEEEEEEEFQRDHGSCSYTTSKFTQWTLSH
ncbi:hypothetical protein LINPERPRIM_LOCUS6036 [Linum perenne]